MTNYKGRLNEYCQQNNLPMPIYSVGQLDGPSHAPIYKLVEVEIVGKGKFTINGHFSKKKEAEQEAAKNAIFKLHSDYLDNIIEEKYNCNPDTCLLVNFDHYPLLKNELIYKSNNGYMVHIFGSRSFNEKILPSISNNLINHIAFSSTPEMVNYMMTWFACETLDTLKSYKKVILISKDKEVNALVEILKSKGIDAELM